MIFRQDVEWRLLALTARYVLGGPDTQDTIARMSVAPECGNTKFSCAVFFTPSHNYKYLLLALFTRPRRSSLPYPSHLDALSLNGRQ